MESIVFVYSDVAKHQYVGNNMAPLLRIVPVDRQSGEHIYRIFDKPYYLPVTRQCIDTIEINLKTDFGDKLIFENGKVLVKLHFKHSTD